VLTHDEVDACAELAEELAAYAVDTQAGRRVGRDECSTKTGPGDFVTSVDLETERRARQRLAETFPDHVVHGEELGTSGDPRSGAPAWYLDPLDGTSNFVHGLPWSSFSLAVADELGLAAAVVADPHRGEIFSARRGSGARANGAPVSCCDADTLEGGLVLTELLGTDPWPGLGEMIEQLGKQWCVTRIPGSTALSLASFAAGRAVAVVLGGFHPIDVAAGMLLAREAGAELLAPPAADLVVQAWALSGTAAAPAHELAAPQRPPNLLVAVAPLLRAELLEVLGSLTS
jgi:fructose-1,6-bisphosphatase/inositol monophosphatase family enzyme